MFEENALKLLKLTKNMKKKSKLTTTLTMMLEITSRCGSEKFWPSAILVQYNINILKMEHIKSVEYVRDNRKFKVY